MSRRRGFRHYELIATVFLGAVACSTQPSPPAATEGEAKASQAEPDELAKPYPPARWRLAPSDDLSRVMLWVSHILIRHDQVPKSSISFDLGDWTVAPAPPARSRAEAFRVASEIAARVSTEPQSFATVARQLSEDIATAERGGSLGGTTAADLYLQHEPVLDALAALPPGTPSRAVETRYGFHVFLRSAPPPEQKVSGSRIVIAHDDAPWLATYLARHDIPARTRADAMSLATSIYQRARSGSRFEDLVKQYSDHREALLGGDFGEWSSHERTPFPREVEILQELEVGEVAAPLDSPFGIEIIKRTPSRPRQHFAMRSVQQRYEAVRPDVDPASRVSVANNMRQLALEVLSNPARFAELQKEYCCSEVEQWSSGRGPAAAEQLMAQLAIGEVGQEPIDLGAAQAIVKRVEPTAAPEPAVLFEFPSPPRPDLHHLASRGLVKYQLAAVGRLAVERLGLQGELATGFLALHTQTGAHDEAELEADRTREFTEFLARVESTLGSDSFARYLDVLHAHFEKLLLTPKPRFQSRTASALRERARP